MTNKSVGKYGEEIACNFLIKKGYIILERNFHFSKNAEIDIIALKNKIIHFVEVKTRASDKYGRPYEAITPSKIASIKACGMFYLKNNKIPHKKISIDAIGIMLNENKEPEIQMLENIALN
ncbi:YraN family protein [bacterium]|nr:YraN family protein [bacterium]